MAIIIALGLTIFSLTDNPAFAQTNQNTSPITCKEGYVILTKQDGTSACVSPSTYLRLIDRSWGMWDRTMMMKQPMMNNVMNQMIQNPELMQQWHGTMIRHQQQMQEIRNQWIEKLKENPQLMANMMGPMTTDLELQQKMIDQIIQHHEMMKSIRNDTQGMGMMMRGPMMGQGMMEQGMEIMHGNCPWCPTSSTPDIQYGTATCPWCPVTNQTMGVGWMMRNPQQMQDMMNQIWQDPQWRQQMHNMMIQKPWHMGPMMNQMMGPMMGPMMNDPQLRQQML